jgi:hypothetical protein
MTERNGHRGTNADVYDSTKKSRERETKQTSELKYLFSLVNNTRRHPGTSRRQPNLKSIILHPVATPATILPATISLSEP